MKRRKGDRAGLFPSPGRAAASRDCNINLSSQNTLYTRDEIDTPRVNLK